MRNRVKLICKSALDATNVQTNAHTVLGRGKYSMTPMRRAWENKTTRLWLVHEKTGIGVLWEIVKNAEHCEIEDPHEMLPK